MPKVLRIINRFNLGGPVFNATYLARYLSPEFETVLAGGLPESDEEDARFVPISHHLEPLIINDMQRAVAPKKDYSAYKQIRAMIRVYKPDIVHTHASKAGALGRLAAYHEKVPVVVHTFHGHVFHSYFSSARTAMYQRAERHLARRCNAIITLSERQKEEICNIYRICPVEKARIIPLGFELSRFTQDSGLKREKFRTSYGLGDDIVAIGIIGRLTPVKDHALFLNALALLKHLCQRKIRAFIIGDGALRKQLELLCGKFQLDDVVVFTGWERSVDKILPGLDIVALSSKNEGTPVSLIEAQAAGIPIAATRVGGVEDVVCEERTALLSPPGDAEALANHLKRLSEDDVLRQEISGNGPGWALARFSVERLAADVRSLYFELIKENGN